jgi:hypoxanthine phosphoribosyltransferase
MTMKERVLLTEKQIQNRVRQLAHKIDRNYKGKEIVLIGVLNGSIIFLADLVRHLKTPLRLDSISASSYGMRTYSSKKVLFNADLKISVKGAHVLLVDDILDTGNTISKLMKAVRIMKPASLQLCIFLEKKVSRNFQFRPKFVGFKIPNHFVYGYGLDYAEQFRNLRCIAYKIEGEPLR